jgi:hypothetical protein
MENRFMEARENSLEEGVKGGQAKAESMAKQ